MGKYLSDPPREKAGDSYLKWIQEVEDNDHWDIAYAIHKDFWQQGYGAEMIQGLVEWCHENGGRKITAAVAKENEGSNAVLRKLGFFVEKEGSFKKSCTDIVYEENIYRLDLK